MKLTWHEPKRARDLREHGLDFVDAESVFAGLTFTFEDDRFEYGERRFITLGLLAGVPVSIVHTETEHEIHVISFRKATKRQGARPSGTSVKSETDWSSLFDPSDKAKPTAEHPEADLRTVMRGIVRRGLKPAPSKTLISLRLDEDVIEWFKAQGPGYQTRINAVLRAFRDASA